MDWYSLWEEVGLIKLIEFVILFKGGSELVD